MENEKAEPVWLRLLKSSMNKLISSQAISPALLGALLTIPTVGVTLLLSRTQTIEGLALLLMGIAAVYFGFAVSDGSRQAVLIEGGVVLLYLALCACGLWVSPLFLVVGYVLHGLWDLVHQWQLVHTKMAAWYVPFCVTYDWIIAAFLLLRLSA